MTLLTTEIPELERVHRGKVRETYRVDDRHLLLVATDRLSAFDVVFDQPIPDKGAVLTVSLCVSLTQLVLIPASAALSDKAGRIRIYTVGAVGIAVRAARRARPEPLRERRSDRPARGGSDAGAGAALDARQARGTDRCRVRGTRIPRRIGTHGELAHV